MHSGSFQNRLAVEIMTEKPYVLDSVESHQQNGSSNAKPRGLAQSCGLFWFYIVPLLGSHHNVEEVGFWLQRHFPPWKKMPFG